MKIGMIVFFSLVTVGAAGFFIGARTDARKTPASPSAEATDTTPTGSAPVARDPRLAGEVAALQAQVAVLSNRDQAAAPVEGSHAKEPAPTRQEQRALDDQRRRAYMAELGATFRKETIDPQWSAATSDLLGKTLEAEDVRLDVRGLECRSRTCRVEIPNNGPADQDKIIAATMKLTATLPSTEVEHTDDGSGNRSTIIYFSRPAPSASR